MVRECAVGLGRLSVVDIEAVLREVSPGPAIPPASDRGRWTEIRSRLGASPVEDVGDEVGRLIGLGEESACADVSVLSATGYLEYDRTGQREGYQGPRSRRRKMLTDLAVAECLEGTGRFLDPLLDVAWAICEEASWVLPAFGRGLADPAHPVIDQGTATTALDLAELDALLGSELDPALSRFIRYEVDRRILTPFLTREDHQWVTSASTRARGVNNWTAVCMVGIAGAAIHLESNPARLAEILSKVAPWLEGYIAAFDVDGGTAEGPGYWSNGVGFYTVLAHLVEHRTGGRASLLDGGRIQAIARYPLRVQLSPGRYVPFSDSNTDVAFNASHLAYLGRRLKIPGLLGLAAEQPASAGQRSGELVWALRRLLWHHANADAAPFVPERHDWFAQLMWMFARVDPADPDALVLAAKGGHNDEMHNHNDVGSFCVHVNEESVIADPGRGRYTRSYTGPERYNHIASSSFGHSVPVPNGHAQLPGREYEAVLLDHQTDAGGDLLRLELSGAYPDEADLDTLERTLRLHREPPGWVEVTDTVRFGSGPGSFETVLITFGQVQLDTAQVMLVGERGRLTVRFDPQLVTPRVETVEKADLAGGQTDLRRVIFAITHPARSATIQLCIKPAN